MQARTMEGLKRTSIRRRSIEDILRNPEEARRIIKAKFPKIVDIEWMRAILLSYLSGRIPLLTKALDSVTAISLDLAGSVRMQEIVSEKTQDVEIIPTIVSNVTKYYGKPFLKIAKYFTQIQEPSVRGDGGFFVFKGDQLVLEKAIRAALEAGKEIKRANQDYRLLRNILKKDIKELNFSKSELEQLRLQLRIGMKTDTSIQSILNLSLKDLDNLLDDNYIFDAKNTVFGNAPNIATRLEVAGKELILKNPELRELPALIVVTPEDLETLERKIKIRFKTTSPEIVNLKDKNWTGEIVLITGYKASSEIRYRTRKKEITELEQSLLNDLSVLQAGVEYWNQKLQDLNFETKEDDGIEFFLLDEIFSLEIGQKELDGLIQKKVITIQDGKFCKRVVVSPQHLERTLKQIGKEIDKKHEWAEHIYESVLERKVEGLFDYRLLARQGFHLKHYDTYKAANVIRRAANIAASVSLDDLVVIYLNEEIKLREQTDRNERERRMGSIDFLRRVAESTKREDIMEKVLSVRKNRIRDAELEIKRLKIRVSMDELGKVLRERQRFLGEKDIEKDITVLKEVINGYTQLLEIIRQLKGTEFEHEFYRAKKVVLSIPYKVYGILGKSEKIAPKRRRAFLYKSLNSALIYEKFCFEDMKAHGKKHRVIKEYMNAITCSYISSRLIADLEKENELEEFSGKSISEIAEKFGISEETARIALMSYEKKLKYARRRSCREGSIARKNGYKREILRAYYNTALYSTYLKDIRRTEMYLSLAEKLFKEIEITSESKQKIQKGFKEIKEKVKKIN